MTSSKKTMLVTGANRGIGLEYVKQYATEGWHVLACCRTPDKAEALHALLQQYSTIQIHVLDVADFAQIDALANQLSNQTIQLLIHNAGVYPSGAFRTMHYEAWEYAFRVNAMAFLKLAEAFLPNLVKAGDAKLVAMTSKMGSIDDNTSGGEYAYRSSKTALNMVVKSLSIDLSKYGIAVAALHPGWVRTDMGGPNGLIDTQTSVRGLRAVIQDLNTANSGQFTAYDGQVIPW